MDLDIDKFLDRFKPREPRLKITDGMLSLTFLLPSFFTQLQDQEVNLPELYFSYCTSPTKKYEIV